MNDNHQSDHAGDELLSAYVDGELAGAELAQVEQRLADDPLAAQLVDELRAIHKGFQTLPQEVVGEDLRATILQRAERTMLLGGKESVATLSARPISPQRRWAWAGLAIAAMLLLSAFLPALQQEEEQGIASAKPMAEKPVAVPARKALRLEALPRGDLSRDVVVAEAMETDSQVAASTSARSAAEGGLGGSGGEDLLSDQEMAELDGSSVGRSRQRDLSSRLPRASLAEAPSPQVDAARVATRSLTSQANPLEVACTVQVTLRGEGGQQAFAAKLNKNGISFPAEETEDDGVKDKDATELVLVEAPIDRLEGLLQSCSADTVHCSALQITRQQVGAEQVAHFAQWQRGVGQVAAETLQGVKRKVASTQKTALGRATRINRNQQQFARQRRRPKQRSSAESSFSLFSSSAPQSAVSPVPIRVLFILQRAASARAPAATSELPR